MTSSFSPTVAVRCVLLFCSLAVLLELWPTVSALISPVSQRDTENVKPKDPVTAVEAAGPSQSRTVVWLLLALGIVVCVACLIAAYIVPQSHEDLHEEAKLKLRDAARRASAADTRLQEAAGKLAEADYKSNDSKEREERAAAALADAAKRESEANARMDEADRRSAEADTRVAAAAANAETSKRERLELANIRKKIKQDELVAAGARAEAEADAARIRDAAEKDRAEAANLLRQAEEKKRNVQGREEACAERERHSAELDGTLRKQSAQLADERRRIDDIAANAKSDRAKAQADLTEAQATNEAAQSAMLKTADARQAIENLRNALWPAWITSGSVSPSIEQIEQWALAGNSNAAVLLSYLQVLQALEKHPDFCKEFNYLWSTVRELGRFLALTLAEDGRSPLELSERLTEWAKALNQCSKGRFTIGVPALGSAFNSAQMDAKGGNVQTISRVVNWSVSNARSIIVSKAEVV